MRVLSGTEEGWQGGVTMTSQTRDRRQVGRLIVPRHLTEPDLELRRVRLLDLSAKGARIEHLEHLHAGLVRSVDLPPILGGAPAHRPGRLDETPPARADL